MRSSDSGLVSAGAQDRAARGRHHPMPNSDPSPKVNPIRDRVAHSAAPRTIFGRKARKTVFGGSYASGSGRPV